MTKYKENKAAILVEGLDLFIIHNGLRIAKLADDDSPQAGSWVLLEPGYTVLEGPDYIEVGYSSLKLSEGRAQW